MILGGREVEIPTTILVLRENTDKPIRLVLQALSPAAMNLARELFPEPAAPTVYLKKDGTGHTYIDNFGAPIEKKDESDPEYVRLKRRSSEMQKVVYFEWALRVDKESSFKSQLNGDPVAYYEDCAKEIQNSGLTQGELLAIMEKITLITALGEDEVRQVAMNFRDPAHEEVGEAVGLETAEEVGTDTEVSAS